MWEHIISGKVSYVFKEMNEEGFSNLVVVLGASPGSSRFDHSSVAASRKVLVGAIRSHFV